jgi:Na+-driven multidrug efflux pump
MLVTVGQNNLNVTGNCITLFGLFGCPKLGVTGVAISSVCSRGAACVALWILLDYRTHLRLRARDFVRIVWSKVGRILRIGLPAAGENMNYWLALMTVTTFTARLGGDSLAIQSYSLQIERVVLLFSLSLGLGTEILIGHLVGAGQFEEAYHTLLKSVRTGLILVCCAILPIALLAPYALGCFTHDLVIIAGGTLLLRLGILLEPGRVFNVIVINSLRATGDVWFPISMCAFSTWCVWVPLAWLLAIKLGFGMPGIWISMIVDEWLRGLMMHRRWKQRHWMKSARRSHEIVAGGAGDTALV